jgi:hypothetical protein
LSGTMRFECIIPNISFQSLRINIIPILSSPLYESLLSNIDNYNSVRNNEPLLLFKRPKMVYYHIIIIFIIIIILFTNIIRDISQ